MSATSRHTVQSLRTLLSTINDPEVPVINIIELGIVRDVSMVNDQVSVTITPTYSGCPAMKMIEDEIRQVLSDHGISQVTIHTVFSPAWTTDWIDDRTKAKLKHYGIAPPHIVQQSPVLQIQLPTVLCPQCNSKNTHLKSEFGSTACKAYYFCDSCRQAFEYFKAF